MTDEERAERIKELDGKLAIIYSEIEELISSCNHNTVSSVGGVGYCLICGKPISMRELDMAIIQ